jgi:glycosyltransferase involved in cell wall biosynthesis
VHKSILVFIDWFDPGYKAGGPIRSAVNFARHLQHHYDVYVFTGDRDLGSAAPYDDIKTDVWISYDEQVKVLYCSPGNLRWKYIRETIQDVNPDHIYLNSLFSKYFTIYPLLINRSGGWKSNMVLAPRGMLRNSALQYKTAKKKLFLRLFRWLSVHRHISFQATDDIEFNDVKKNFGESARVLQIPNFPAYVQGYPGSLSKGPGELSIIFVGRLHPIKNLHFLLERLKVLKGKVLLTVIGSEEDKAYVDQCRSLSVSLSDNITVKFEGEKPNHELPAIIAQHHVFGLPTQGENFGHAIFEGLSAGKPVLISDQTPWRGLVSVKAGWDISLADNTGFEKALQEALDMEQDQYDEWSMGAWQYAHQFSAGTDALSKYTTLFQ